MRVVDQQGSLVTIEDDNGRQTKFDTSSMNPGQKAMVMALPRKQAATPSLPTESPLMTKINNMSAGLGLAQVGPRLPPVAPPAPEVSDQDIAAAANRGALPVQPAAPPMALPNNLDPIAAQLAAQQGHIQKNSTDQQKRLDTALSKEEDAINTSVAVGKAQAAEEAGYQDEMQKQKEKQAADFQDKEKIRQDALDTQRKKYSDLSDDLANSKIKPWVQPIGDRIAAALMTLGSVMAHGSADVGIEFLNRQMNADMERQKADIDSKRTRLSAQGNLIQATREAFGDERASDAAARALMWEAAEKKLLALQARQKSTTMDAKAGELLAGVQAKKADALNQLDQQTNNNVTQVLNQRAVVAKAQDDNAIELMKANAKAGGKQLDQSTVEKISNLQSELSGLESLEKSFYAKTGPTDVIIKGSIPYTSGREYEDQRKLAETELINKITGAGVSLPEAQRISALLPRSGTLNSDAKVQWAALKDEIKTKVNNLLGNLMRSGYDTAGIKPAGNVSSFKAVP